MEYNAVKVTEENISKIEKNRYYFRQKEIKVGDTIIFCIDEEERIDGENITRSISLQPMVYDEERKFFIKLTI